MYKKEFLTKLDRKELNKSLLLFGDSTYFIDLYMHEMLKSLSNDIDIIKLYYDEYNYDVAIKSLNEASLFSSGTALVIKTDKVLNNGEITNLIKTCKKSNNNYFYLCYYGNNSKGLTSLFSNKNGGDFVRFFQPNYAEAKSFLISKANEIGLKIDQSATEFLLSIFELDLDFIFKEMQKLLLLNKKITVEDVQNHTYSLSLLKIEDFYLKIVTKKSYLNDFNSLIDSGEDEIRLFSGFNNFISQLWTFNIYIRLNGVLNTQDILGYRLPQQIENQKRQLAVSFKSEIYEQILDESINYELLLKRGGDKNSILLAYFSKISSFL